MGEFKDWLIENFGPGHTGGMNPPLQKPFTLDDAKKRPNDPLGISGTKDDFPPVKKRTATARHKEREDKKLMKKK